MADDNDRKRPLEEDEVPEEEVTQAQQPKRRRRTKDEPVDDLSTARKRLVAQFKRAKNLRTDLFNADIKDVDQKKTNSIPTPSTTSSYIKVVERSEEIKNLAKELEIDYELGLSKNEGRQQAKYFVTGISGCGKSTLVLEIVARLRLTEKTRVIYLHDLKGPIYEDLLHAMVHAFPEDEYIRKRCQDACEDDYVSIDKVISLYEDFPGYCFERRKSCYMVVDDLEKFYDRSSGLADFLVPLVQRESYSKWVTTIFVGTPSSKVPMADAFLGDPVYIEPRLEISCVKAMLREMDIDLNSKELKELEERTGFVPGEIKKFTTFVTKGKDDFATWIDNYVDARAIDYTTDVENHSKFLEGVGGTKEFAMGVLLMKLKIPVSAQMDYAILPTLMYQDKDGVIHATSKLAHEVIIDLFIHDKLEKKAAVALISKVFDKDPSEYSEEVRITVTKLLVANVIATTQELRVENIVELKDSRKKYLKEWHFKGLEEVDYNSVPDASVHAGNYLMRPRYNLDSLGILMENEEDGTPAGLTVIDFCLNAKDMNNDFFASQAALWVANEELVIRKEDVRHLWVILSGLNQKATNKDERTRMNKSKKPKDDEIKASVLNNLSKVPKSWGEKPKHFAVSLKDLIEANDDLEQLKLLL